MIDGLLDASILFSFDRSGFERHARDFRAGDLDVELAGRVCLVTGATSGIGQAAAHALAERGAEVWLLCRSAERGERARERIAAASGNDRVFVAVVDLSELASVRAFAERFERERVDVLIHNAGLLAAGRQLTGDGLELAFATHVAGPFLLSRLLEEPLAAAGGRVIFVSSGGMYTQRLSLDDQDWSRRDYDGVRAYAQTKRMQVVLAELLAEHWTGRGIRCHAMHPGWADTPGVRTSLPRFRRVLEGRLRTPEQGADTVVWLALAAAPGGSSGGFWFDRRPAATHLLPWTREDAGERRTLWRRCEQLAADRVRRAARDPQERWALRMLYDGRCPLCRREVAALRRLDRARGRLDFEDIAADDFEAERYGVSAAELMARIHGVLPDGTVIEGVEVFRRAYGLVGLGWLLAPTRWPGLRRAADAGYRWFARNRHRLTGRPEPCGDPGCAVRLPGPEPRGCRPGDPVRRTDPARAAGEP